MNDPRTTKDQLPLLCRVLGHRWRPSHVLTKDYQDREIWAYVDHVCTRCWITEKRNLWATR